MRKERLRHRLEEDNRPYVILKRILRMKSVNEKSREIEESRQRGGSQSKLRMGENVIKNSDTFYAK